MPRHHSQSLGKVDSDNDGCIEQNEKPEKTNSYLDEHQMRALVAKNNELHLLLTEVLTKTPDGGPSGGLRFLDGWR